MNKDFSKAKLLAFSDFKKLKVLHDLASFAKREVGPTKDKALLKLNKYHSFLANSDIESVRQLNTAFSSLAKHPRGLENYLMLLERFLGITSSEYDLLLDTKDKHSSSQKFPIVCVLDSIRSAHNLGAIIRNCECFGVEKLYVTGLSPKHNSSQVKKTAMGCDQLVDCEYRESVLDLIEELKAAEYSVYAIETTRDYILPSQVTAKKIALVFGHEQYGVSLAVLKKCMGNIRIPLYGQKNSLNLAISNGIVLSEVTKQLQKQQ